MRTELSSALLGCARPVYLPQAAGSSHVARQTIRYASSKRGGSSSRYLQRQRNDVFVKQRAAASTSLDDDELGGTGGFVARSAFKLLQLDDRYKFLKPARVIVDLGAAPGGWSQAIVERTRKGKHKEGSVPIFALDLLPVIDVPGVTSIQGDFLDPMVQAKLLRMVEDAVKSKSGVEMVQNPEQGFVDVVVSDMMANTTGNPITDTENSLELCRAAATFAFSTLKSDTKLLQSDTSTPKAPKALASTCSVLVMKYFMSHEADLFRKEVLERHFRFVKAEKMAASRKESREQFWVCIGYKGQLPP